MAVRTRVAGVRKRLRQLKTNKNTYWEKKSRSLPKESKECKLPILRAVLAFGRERRGRGPCRESESREGLCCLVISSKRKAPGGVRKWY